MLGNETMKPLSDARWTGGGGSPTCDLYAVDFGQNLMSRFNVWSDLGNVKHTIMFVVYLFSCDLPIAYYEILSGNL